MPPTRYTIDIANEQPRAFNQDRLVTAVETILSDYQYTEAEVSIAFVDDPTIRELNRQYLNHDYETDVISFVLEEDEESLVAQLIVSTDTAARMADELGALFENELLLYVVHGSLHLVGLDDQQPEQAEEMRAEEKRVLAGFGVPHVWRDPEVDVNAAPSEGSSDA